MAMVPLSGQAYSRTGLPQFRLVNLFRETTPEGPTPYALRQRPGLTERSRIGVGPIRAVITHAGSRYVVSGTRIYRDGQQLGVIPGLYRVRFAASDNQLVVVSEGRAYLIGVAVTVVAMPDDDPVSDVKFSAGRFIYAIAGSGKYRYSEIGDAEDIGDLNFATAEAAPDDIVSIETIGNDVLFFGEATTEWWGPTGDTAAPFQPYTGRRYDVGSAAQNSAVSMDNGIFWIGTAQAANRTDLKVYRTGSVPEVVSTPAIDALLARSASIERASAIEVAVEGRSFYVLNIPGVTTVAYDMRDRLWCEWASYGRQTFRLQCAEAGLYGDEATNQLWSFSSRVNRDGGDAMVRVCSAYIPVTGKTRNASVELYGATGEPTSDPDPCVEMRYTDHDDTDWTDWDRLPIGPTGIFPRAQWRGLGLMEPAGRLFEFRCSDDVLFSPFGMTINE